jgi:hypothetical protein
MSYGLKVRNIENVTATHIHQGKEGVNGPVIVPTYKVTYPSGESVTGM